MAVNGEAIPAGNGVPSVNPTSGDRARNEAAAAAEREIRVARSIQRLTALFQQVSVYGEAIHEMMNRLVDPDELSYEELLAICEAVGTVSKGVSADTVASLGSLVYKEGAVNDPMCVICQLDYEAGEELNLLRCKHSYHCSCLRDWLRNNKVCPVCSAEVSPP